MAGANGMKRSADTVSSHSSPYCRVARYFREPSTTTNMRIIQAMIPTGPMSTAKTRNSNRAISTHPMIPRKLSMLESSG